MEEAAMSLMTVLSVSLRPDRFSLYEARVQRLAEKAVAKKEPFEWAAHQVMAGALGTIHFTSEARDWATLSTREPIDMLIRKIMGDTEGTQFIDQLSECVLSERYTIGQERTDLSYPPDQQSQMKPFGTVTIFRARPGGQDAVEELIRKVAHAIPQTKDPRRFMAYQTVMGDLRTYWAVVPLADVAELDAMLPLPELLHKAFGAEGALIYRSGIDAIERLERQLTVLRPELSNGAWVPAFQARMATARRGVAAGMPRH
jgi:hypothetical protein